MSELLAIPALSIATFVAIFVWDAVSCRRARDWASPDFGVNVGFWIHDDFMPSRALGRWLRNIRRRAVWLSPFALGWVAVRDTGIEWKPGWWAGFLRIGPVTFPWAEVARAHAAPGFSFFGRQSATLTVMFDDGTALALMAQNPDGLNAALGGR